RPGCLGHAPGMARLHPREGRAPFAGRSRTGSLVRVSVSEPLTRADPAPPRVLPIPGATGKAVVRTALLNRLCGTADGTITTLVAPAGFGKTTLLAQWADRDRRPVLWIDLEPEDDDAELLESRLAAIGDEPKQLVLVDDVHVLRTPGALAIFERLLAH